MVSKLKRLPTEWEKIFDNYTCNKRIITRIYIFEGAKKTILPKNQLPKGKMDK
jgi:hypothetical protein